MILRFAIIGLTKSGRAAKHGEEDTRKDTSIVLILQEQFCTSELFKVISGCNLIDPTLQDNVIILDGFLKYIFTLDAQFTFHHQFQIDTGRSKFEQSTDSILSAFILKRSTWEHRVLHGTCIQHGRNIKIRCIGSDIDFALKKGLKFYQTRSNAIILHDTLPAYCIPKVVRMETGEVIFEKVFLSPRPPPKTSLKHEWNER